MKMGNIVSISMVDADLFGELIAIEKGKAKIKLLDSGFSDILLTTSVEKVNVIHTHIPRSEMKFKLNELIRQRELRLPPQKVLNRIAKEKAHSQIEHILSTFTLDKLFGVARFIFS